MASDPMSYPAHLWSYPADLWPVMGEVARRRELLLTARPPLHRPRRPRPAVRRRATLARWLGIVHVRVPALPRR